MKFYSIILIIMTLFFSKLNALETITDIKEAREIINQARAAEKVEQARLDSQRQVEEELSKPKMPIKYELVYVENIPDQSACNDCPTYLSLTSHVQQVLNQLETNDPTSTMNDELKVKQEIFKYQYFDAKKSGPRSYVTCKLDQTLENSSDKHENVAKLDVQLNLLAQDVFSFPSVQSVNVFDPNFKQNISYYRDKDVITEISLNPKSGGMIVRYFKTAFQEATAPEKMTIAPLTPALRAEEETSRDQNGITFGFDVEKKYKDVRLMKAYGELPITSQGVSLVGQSSTSLAKGNQAKINLQDNGQSVVAIDLHTKLDGKTEHIITIPYSIRLAGSGIHILGDAQTGSKEDVVHLRLTGDENDYLHSEYRRTSAGNESWYVAHDLIPGSLTLTAGKEGQKYIGLQKRTSIGKRLTTVLTVKIEEGTGSTVTYQAEYPF